VDFGSLGIFMPNKKYGSASEATKTLAKSREKVQSYLDQSKVKQIANFKSAVSETLKQDRDVCVMP
jgi:hypothetical protein